MLCCVPGLQRIIKMSHKWRNWRFLGSAHSLGQVSLLEQRINENLFYLRSFPMWHVSHYLHHHNSVSQWLAQQLVFYAWPLAWSETYNGRPLGFYFQPWGTTLAIRLPALCRVELPGFNCFTWTKHLNASRYFSELCRFHIDQKDSVSGLCFQIGRVSDISIETSNTAQG